MRKTYITIDGKHFDNKSEAIQYELQLSDFDVFSILVKTSNGNKRVQFNKLDPSYLVAELSENEKPFRKLVNREKIDKIYSNVKAEFRNSPLVELDPLDDGYKTRATYYQWDTEANQELLDLIEDFGRDIHKQIIVTDVLLRSSAELNDDIDN